MEWLRRRHWCFTCGQRFWFRGSRRAHEVPCAWRHAVRHLCAEGARALLLRVLPRRRR